MLSLFLQWLFDSGGFDCQISYFFVSIYKRKFGSTRINVFSQTFKLIY